MEFLGVNKESPIIVAEIGSSFDSFDHLSDTINKAKECGADCVKIQYYTAHSLVHDNGAMWSGYNLYQLYKDTEFPDVWLNDAFHEAKTIGIPLFSSVYHTKDIPKLELVNCPAYKISSFENECPELLRAVDDLRKPWVISAGMLSIHQLRDILKSVNPTVVMHCVSKYPCSTKEAYLIKIKQILDTVILPGWVGYSDHCSGSFAAEYATALGARMIEKHFRLGGEFDGYTSRPDSFISFVGHIERAYEALWNECKDELYGIKQQRLCKIGE